jgi:predicted KAP-like P-loop ATPase
MSETVDVWEGDLFDRAASARVLHKLVLQKFKEEQYNSVEALCFSVDGDWGAGKSFFLKRWAQDLRNQQHAVIEFDAWANDLSEEPLLGFLAELRDVESRAKLSH